MGAMHEEVASIVAAMQIEAEETMGSRTYFSGHLCDQEVVVVFSHWGKVAASITATSLITTFGVDEIIFTGVAGAIDSTLSVGDIVIGNSLYQHDMDASPIIERHEIPLLGRAAIIASPTIRDKLSAAATKFIDVDQILSVGQANLSKFNISNPSVVVADIASGDQFVSDRMQAIDIRTRLPSVACVEMEGAAVAQVCESFNVPFGLIRTISDAANETSDVDFLSFVTEVAQVYSLGIVRRFLTA